MNTEPDKVIADLEILRADALEDGAPTAAMWIDGAIAAIRRCGENHSPKPGMLTGWHMRNGIIHADSQPCGCLDGHKPYPQPVLVIPVGEQDG